MLYIIPIYSGPVQFIEMTNNIQIIEVLHFVCRVGLWTQVGKKMATYCHPCDTLRFSGCCFLTITMITTLNKLTKLESDGTTIC